MSKIFEIIERLDQAGIHYTLASYRTGMIMIIAAFPGKRVEIEISDSGDVDIESFSSDGKIDGEIGLAALISDFSD